MHTLWPLSRLRLLLLLGVLALPLTLAACGGDDDDDDSSGSSGSVSTKKVDVDDWTKGLCKAVTGWQSDIESLSQDLDFEDSSDADDIKDGLVGFFEKIDKRTKTFKKDVDGLGNPDIDDGAKIQSALRGAAGDVVKIFADSLADVKKVDTKDAAGLVAELTAIGQSLEDAGTEVADAFAQIDSDFDTTEITKAAEDIPECEDLF